MERTYGVSRTRHMRSLTASRIPSHSPTTVTEGGHRASCLCFARPSALPIPHCV